MSRGGPREGAGRRPSGIRKQTVVLRLRSEVANALRAAVPGRTRSDWIEELIVEALKLPDD